MTMIRNMVRSDGSAESSGLKLIMPHSSFMASFIDARASKTSVNHLGSAVAWTALSLDHTTEDYSTVVVAGTADTNEQVIANVVSGQGILTHVTTTATDASLSGVITVTITVDGVELDPFVSETLPTGSARLCIGDFKAHSSDSSEAFSGLGGAQDSGYSAIATSNAYLPTPKQTISQGRIGIPFFESLEVKQQSSVNFRGDAYYQNSLVAYSRSIPDGVIAS